MAGAFEFEITEHIAVIAEKDGWDLELNRVRWNGAAPKLDLRRWSKDHEKPGKGLALTEEEAAALERELAKIV